MGIGCQLLLDAACMGIGCLLLLEAAAFFFWFRSVATQSFPDPGVSLNSSCRRWLFAMYCQAICFASSMPHMGPLNVKCRLPWVFFLSLTAAETPVRPRISCRSAQAKVPVWPPAGKSKGPAFTTISLAMAAMAAAAKRLPRQQEPGQRPPLKKRFACFPEEAFRVARTKYKTKTQWAHAIGNVRMCYHNNVCMQLLKHVCLLLLLFQFAMVCVL